MNNNSLYISVESPCTSAGTLTLYIEADTISSTDPGMDNTTVNGFVGFPESFNLPSLLTLSLNVSGIVGNETEIQLAQKLYNQLGTFILQQGINYKGFLSYAEEQYPATFQTTVTEHCVGLWSQAWFRLSVTTNTTGAYLLIDKHPTLSTVQYFLDNSFISNFDNTTDFGGSLDTYQIAQMARSASAYIIRKLRNPIVMTTFGRELRGTDHEMIYLQYKPVWDFDQPRIRRKNIVDIFNLPQWGKFAYYVDHETGKLFFRFNEFLIDHREPFYKDNLVYVSFIGGYPVIPIEIKDAIIALAKFRLHHRDGIKSMKGGSGSFDYIPYDEELKNIFDPIIGYKIRRR